MLSSIHLISLLYDSQSKTLSLNPAHEFMARCDAKADLSTVFIRRIEQGKEFPSVHNLVKIARALGVRVRDLVEGF